MSDLTEPGDHYTSKGERIRLIGEDKLPGDSTGKWRLPHVPKSGWKCVGVHDSNADRASIAGKGEEGDLHPWIAVCQMCEKEEIRFIHYMVHDNYPNVLACGCDCSGFMEGDLAAALKRKKFLESYARTRDSWMKEDAQHKTWILTKYGTLRRNVDGLTILIIPTRDGRWSYHIRDSLTKQVHISEPIYLSDTLARRGAHDVMIRVRKLGPDLPALGRMKAEGDTRAMTPAELAMAVAEFL